MTLPSGKTVVAAAKLLNISQRNHLVKRLQEVFERKKSETEKLFPRIDYKQFMKDHAPRKTVTTAELIALYEEHGNSYSSLGKTLESIFGIQKAYDEASEVVSSAKKEALKKLDDYYQNLKDRIIFDVSTADAMEIVEQLNTWKP